MKKSIKKKEANNNTSGSDKSAIDDDLKNVTEKFDFK